MRVEQPKIIFIPETKSWTAVDSCDWVLPYLNATRYDGNQNLDDYQVLVYIKTKDVEQIRYHTHKVQFYLTQDPIWRYMDEKLKTIDLLVDGFIVHTPGMWRGMSLRYPQTDCHIVPDGINLSFPGVYKKHTDKPVIFGWFGTSVKFAAPEVQDLISAMLSQLGDFDLRVIADKTVPLRCIKNFTHIPWTPEFYNDLQNCDVVLNPLDSDGLRSRNKHFIAWNMGLPVIETIDDIPKFLKYEDRVKEAVQRKEYVKRHDIYYSAQRWLEIIQCHM